MTELTDAYFRWYRGDKSYEWARDHVEDIFEENMEMAWTVTRELINAAPSKDCLSYIAAGQLEILICRYGSDVIELIKNEARQNKRLAYAMTGVYLSELSPLRDEYIRFLKHDLGLETEEDVDNLVDLDLPDN